MGICELCGNQYDKTFTVRMGEREAVYDSFECAIHDLAPRCAHCGCRVIGHGIEREPDIFCCAHCAKQSGVQGARDRVG